ncbi:MAG: hypothetical protein R3B70_25685 [Polyangiaceae bacterium]
MINARAGSFLLLSALALQGCFWGDGNPYAAAFGQKSSAQSMKEAQTTADDRTLDMVDKARAKAKATPGGVDEARTFAEAISAAITLGALERRQISPDTLLAEASDALEASVIAFPDQKAEAMFSKGSMYLAAGKTDDAVTALRASMDARPSPRACVTLIAELDKQGDPKKEIVPLCKKTRPSVSDEETKFNLLDACLEHTHATSVDEGLKWAGLVDIRFYKEYTIRIQAENEARRRDEEARAERERADAAARAEEARRRQAQMSSQSMGSSGSGSSGNSSGSSASSGPWRVTLHNECKQTVKLFLGKKPKWGSGTYTSIGSNTISSYSGSPGDMIWIVDDGQNGLSSLSPSGTQRVKILSGCTGFAPD